MTIGSSIGAFHEDAFHAEAAPFMEMIDPSGPKSADDNVQSDLWTQQQLQYPGNKTPTPIADNDDNLDYTDAFNTPVDNVDKYLKWRDSLGTKLGRDMSKETYDYDLQGAYKAGVNPAENGHLPDTFKKPNHPTFSDQSIYHNQMVQFQGEDKPLKAEGGHWDKGDDGRDKFTPGSFNHVMRDPQSMIDYFSKNEPNVDLILPSQ